MSTPDRPGTPSRPRIRRAHSDQQAYGAPQAGPQAGPQVPAESHAAPPHHATAPHPAAPPQPAAAPPHATPGTPEGPAPQSAAHDRSTYYEYIAQHSGEHRAAAGSAPTGYAAGSPAGPGQPGAPGYGSGGPHGPVPPYGAGAHSGPGGPAPRRSRGRGFLIAGLAVVVIAALTFVLTTTLLGPDRGMQSTDAESSEPASSDDGPSPEASASVPAGEQLNAQVEVGTRIAQDDLADEWVVQLSAKKPGLEASGKTWAEEDILAEFTENQRRHPEAILLWSGDWSSFRLDDFWVTVLAQPYDTPEEALETCRNLGLDRDNCFAKKLSTSERPDGTTMLND